MYMKNQLNSNKMLLTTALLAVLGANYTFQQNSVELNHTRLIEMSSTAADAKKDASIQPKVKAKKTKDSENESPNDSSKNDAQAITAVMIASESACPNGTCANIAGDSKIVMQASVLKAIVDEAIKSSPTKATASPTTSEDRSEAANECHFAKDGKKETRAERKEREECELRIKSDELETVFAEAMDNLKDRCEGRSEDEIQCLTEGYTKELKKAKYFGKGRKELLSDSFAKSQLRDLIGSKLAKTLDKIDPNDHESLEKIKDIVSSLMDTLPESYGLKTLTLNSFKSYLAKRANSVVALYTQARNQDKNNPQAALAARNQAFSEAQEFRSTAEAIIQGAMSSNLQEDSTAYKYYNTGFLPDIHKMFLAVNNPIAKDIQNNPAPINETTASNQSNSTPATTTRNANRGGQVVQPNGQISGKVGYDNYQGTFSINGAGQAWQVQQPSNNLNAGTVTVGQPTMQPGQSNRGTRNGGTAAPVNRQGSVFQGIENNF